MDKELQRELTLIELDPRPYFSIINVHLVNINVFAKFYEIPPLPFQDIEKLKRLGRTDGRTNGRTDNVKTVYPPQTQFAGGIKRFLHQDIKIPMGID